MTEKPIPTSEGELDAEIAVLQRTNDRYGYHSGREQRLGRIWRARYGPPAHEDGQLVEAGVQLMERPWDVRRGR